MKKTAIILAGGEGRRMKSEIPKQFLLLKKKPVLIHTLEKFSEFDKIIVVLPKSQIKYWETLCLKYKCSINHSMVKGGETRFDSVKNGLHNIIENSIVMIHDGVRPLVSKKTINTLIENLSVGYGIVPVISIKDSIRKIEGTLSTSINRKNMFKVLTPQCFLGNEIKNAYSQKFSESFTDDACVFEKNGGKIKTIIGERINMKITIKEDLEIIKSLM